MDILIAIAHILGSLISLLVIGYVLLMLQIYESKKIKDRAAEEASLELGVKIEDLDNEEYLKKLLNLYTIKFSSELLKNRLSDFCGFLIKAWGWFSNLIQVVILILVIWYTITDSVHNSIYAWFLPVISVFSLIISLIFSFTCKLLTGRYPGEAKTARKAMIEWIKESS